MSSEVSSTFANNVVGYDANNHNVHQVTVYQSNRAEVKRKIQIKLERGQNDVEVKNLPTRLEESSIRVDGIGNATIFDVIYHRATPPKRDTANEELQKLDKKKAALGKELEIYNQQAKFIEDYAKTLSGRNADSGQLETFLDVYATRQTRINESIATLLEEQKSVEKEMKEKSVTLNTDEESLRLRGTRVTIIVLADEAGDAELSLTYVVSGAFWTPQYDLRAVIAPDEKTESSVNLHYRASISQFTGEDWTNVTLTLSTASPLLGTAIPTLDPYWIGERLDTLQTVKPRAYPDRSAARRYTLALAAPPPPPILVSLPTARESSMDHRRAVVDGEEESPPPGFFRSRDAAISSDGAVSKTFTILGLSSIPSSTSKNSQAHKVSIAELEFSSVGLRWISVPKSIASAFLQCKVKNTSDYVLLAGDASVFLNGNFVSKSSLPHVSPQESFSCSLGVDPAVRVTYHPQRKKTKTSGGSVLTTKMTTTVFEQGITIKNTRLAPLRDLRVRDQVPVSSDARIKVNLFEPKQLVDAKNKIVYLSEGINAKWVQRDEDEAEKSSTLGGPDVNAETAQGMFEWICEIEPGASKDLTFVYEISAPSAVPWTKQ